MSDFWHFARRMLHQRWLLAWALFFAMLSAGGFGVGLLGLLPVLKNVLPAEEGAKPAALAEIVRGVLSPLPHSVQNLIPTSWIDALPTGQFDAVLWMVIGLGILTAFGAAANFMHAYCSLTIISRTIAGIRRDAFRRAVHLPLRSVLSAGGPVASEAGGGGSGGASDLVSRIVLDTANLGQGFNALLSKAVAQLSKGAAAMVVAFFLHPLVALIALLVALPMAVILRKIGKRIRRASRRALEGQSGLYQSASEVLGSLRVVKVHGTERMESGRFHRINKRVVQQEFRVRTARALASPLIEVLALFILGSFALVAAKQIIDHRLDSKTFLMVFAALGAGAASLKPLTGFLNDIQQSSAAAVRLRQLLGAEPEAGHDRGLPEVPALAPGEALAFEHVTFTYPHATASSLRDVSLEIRHGQTVAFVGPNGCGKTTLLSLLPRLFDPDNTELGGRVLWNGQDIRGFSVRSLRRRIAVVTQETILFKGSIAFNIAYGAPHTEHADQKIREAARRARAEEFILAKPGGFGFEVGEGGAGLSGGQRQRIAIARAMLRDPQVLILDEATSMIDAESEARISEAISDFVSTKGRTSTSIGGDSATEARTCLIVAHRLSTVIASDRIVVMDQGRIVDQGTHSELLGRCALYQSLVNNQLIRSPAASGGVQPGQSAA